MVDDLIIEPAGYEKEVMVVRYSIYPESSVLSGQTCRSRLGYFPTVEAALEKYPGTRVVQYQGRDPFGPVVSDIPPSDFDPTICGEVWHEDDT